MGYFKELEIERNDLIWSFLDSQQMVFSGLEQKLFLNLNQSL